MSQKEWAAVLIQDVRESTVSPEEFPDLYDEEDYPLLLGVIRLVMDEAAERDDVERYNLMDDYLGAVMDERERLQEKKWKERDEIDRELRGNRQRVYEWENDDDDREYTVGLMAAQDGRECVVIKYRHQELRY